MRIAAFALLIFLVAGGLFGTADADIPVPGPQRTASIWTMDVDVAFDLTGETPFDHLGDLVFHPLQETRAPVAATYIHPVVYWFRIDHPQRWRGWILSVARDIDHARLYSFVDGRYTARSFGMLVPFASRPIARSTPSIEIPAGIAATKPMYLRLVLPQDYEPISFSTAAAAAVEDSAERRVLIDPLLVCLSMCLALGLANLVIFAFVRDRTLLIYSVTMASAIVLGLTSRPGLGWIYVWPHASLSYYWSVKFALYAYYAMIAIFSLQFLRLPARHPRWAITIVSALTIYIILDFILGACLPEAALGGHRYDLLNMTDPIYLGLVLLSGIVAWKGGQSSARFFIIASSGLFLGITFDELISWFPAWQEQRVLFPFLGVTWEGTLLFAALAHQYNRATHDRERATSALIAQAERHSAEHEYAATHDSLTGLGNRRSLEFQLARLAELPEGHSDAYGLAYVDLDHFKLVNDSFGHSAGDQLLVLVAERLRVSTDEDDVIARIGGDEFLILMRRRSREQLIAQAERLRETLALVRFAWENNAMSLSASVGLAIVGSAVATPVALMSLADAACADAKELGRNRVSVVADEGSAIRTKYDMDWATRITQALESEQLRLFAQSVVPFDGTSNAKSIEILVRLVDGDDIVPPSHFLPSAERYGVMARLDAWVIRRALELCAPAARAGTMQSVSVNLSGSFLRRPDALTTIQKIIEDAAFPPERLCLEITETVATTSIGDLTKLIDVLGAQGVRFALDDFGTGTSSLALLRRLDIDYVKIDGSFVQDCASDSVDAAIVESIVALARVLGIATVAEYVVDEATAERLRGLGVDYGQGWYFDHARPIDEVLGNSAFAEK